mmetsp:Transcript_8266/g.27194  ORF Transcript_8266/g.27194 Transcript_8266/m.27194 type:complete len:242 (+) Transcript_8266:1860-2585(+)
MPDARHDVVLARVGAAARRPRRPRPARHLRPPLLARALRGAHGAAPAARAAAHPARGASTLHQDGLRRRWQEDAAAAHPRRKPGEEEEASGKDLFLLRLRGRVARRVSAAAAAPRVVRRALGARLRRGPGQRLRRRRRLGGRRARHCFSVRRAPHADAPRPPFGEAARPPAPRQDARLWHALWLRRARGLGRRSRRHQRPLRCPLRPGPHARADAGAHGGDRPAARGPRRRGALPRPLPPR